MMDLNEIERVLQEFAVSEEDVHHAWDLRRNDAMIRVAGATKSLHEDPVDALRAAQDMVEKLTPPAFHVARTTSIGAVRPESQDVQWRGHFDVLFHPDGSSW